MKMLNYEDFMRDFGKMAKQTMNLSIYKGQWQCACGKSHNFNEHTLDIIGQGAVMRLMIMCPDDPHYVTNVKIKTFMIFKFLGFESLSGAKMTDKELEELAQIASVLSRY